jgi:hypothetical protein
MLFLLGFLGIAMLVLRPVPISKEKGCSITKGMVVEIYEAGTKDERP